MSPSKSLLAILYFSLTIHATLCVDPLFHFCFSQTNYSTSSPYSDNLKNLLSSLSTKVPPTGFGLGSTGQGQDRVNGLALCRGDVSIKNCESCVGEAGQELVHLCPNYKGAVVLYDYCLLKYSDEQFFGKIDYQNRFYMWNINKVDQDEASFNEKTKEFLSGLANKVDDDTKKLYATGEMKLGESEKLYGLVQCSRDVNVVDCKKCLDGAISELPSCCDGKRGGRVVGPTCNFRYELYPFVES